MIIRCYLTKLSGLPAHRRQSNNIMIQSKRAALSVLVFLVMATPCLGKSWRGITPLKSTRADVEHLLGASTTDPPTYYFSDETVQIEYSKCRCEQKCSYDEWNVPPGTVTRIRVRLKREVKLAVLQLKLAEFEKIGDADLVDQFVLVNEKEGFAVEVGRGSVFGFIYEPLAED